MAKQLKLQVVLDMMDKVTTPFKSINARAAKMGSLLKQNKSHLKMLEKASAGMQAQHMAMQAKGIRVSDNLVNAENRLQKEITETTAAIDKQKNALGQLNQKARRLRKISAHADNLGNMGSRLTARMTLPIAGGLTLAAREAMMVEKAMASVSKFAPEFGGDLAKQAEFMGQVKQSAADLSMQTGKTQVDIAAMYEEMGAAGVAANKWDAYSKQFIKGAVALDMDIGELSQIALGIMASTGNKGNTDYLSALLEKANLASDMGKMRAANVLNVVNRSMGLAKQAGISDNAFIGLTGAALDAGGQDDVTGRAWKTIIARLTSTAKLTKAQGSAWKALNIDPETFTKAFKDDPIGKLEQLTKAAQANADGMGELGIIVGTEFVDTVVKMGSNVDTARKIQAGLADEQLRAIKLQGEYNRMAATTDTQLKRGVSTLKVMGNTIGSRLLPRINELLNRVQPLIKKTSEWIDKNPELTDSIIAITAALVLLGPVLYTTGTALKAFTFINQVLPLLASLGGGIKILMGILAANPVTASIIAIAGGAMLLYQNWEKVVAWFDKKPFVQIVKDMPAVRSLFDLISGSIGAVVALLTGDWAGAWDNAKIVGKSAMDILTAPVRGLFNLIKKLAGSVGIDLGKAFEIFSEIVTPIVNKVKNIFSSLLNQIESAIHKTQEFFAVSNAFFGGDKDTPSGLDWIKDMGRGIVGLEPTYGGKVPATPKAADKAATLQAKIPQNPSASVGGERMPTPQPVVPVTKTSTTTIKKRCIKRSTSPSISRSTLPMQGAKSPL